MDYAMVRQLELLCWCGVLFIRAHCTAESLVRDDQLMTKSVVPERITVARHKITAYGLRQVTSRKAFENRDS